MENTKVSIITPRVYEFYKKYQEVCRKNDYLLSHEKDFQE